MRYQTTARFERAVFAALAVTLIAFSLSVGQASDGRPRRVQGGATTAPRSQGTTSPQRPTSPPLVTIEQEPPPLKPKEPPLPPGQEINPDETIRISTAEVKLSVRVVDRNNRPIPNLRPEDFRVYEDGVEQKITFFSKEEVPISYGLVVDNSGSMRYLLDKVIESARIIINSNKPGDETFLVRFISSDKIETLLDFTSDKQALSEALDNLYIEAGQTAVIDAVYLASERVSEYKRGDDDDRRRRALILITDGEDRSSFYNQNQLFRQLRESNVQIYVIGFVDELDREGSFIRKSTRERAINLINRLANETGGRAFFPKSINELPQIAEEITRDLRTQYVIGYSPTNKARDGSFRNVRVVVANGPGGEKRIAITRPGYYAPNEQSPNGNQPPRRPVANGVRTPPK